MPPGVFRHNDQYRSSHERLFSDVEVYRALGSTAEKAIRFGETVIEPRDYQGEAWSAINGARAEGKDSALVHLATGLGKTTVAVVDALNFAVDFYEREGRMPKMMFAVHQTEILEQAALRFKEFAPSLSQGSFVGGEKDTDSLLTFASMQSLSQNLENLDPNEFDYIAYDEAHHAQAQTYRKVVKHFNPSFKLALTATPDRMDEEDIRELFGNEVYSKTLAEAMGEGLLVDVDYHIVFDEAVKRAMEEGFTPETLSEIRELLKNTARNEEIAEQIKDQVEQIGLEEAKTIVFCDSISQANEMAKLLGGKAYHSEADDLEDILDGFRNGSQQIITTCDMFNEGVDVPDTRLVVFLRATGSRTIFEQQLGRGMRKHPGKDVLSVLDFVGNIERLSQIKELVDAITEARIRENGEGEDDVALDDLRSEGIAIRTDHTEFDFDRIVVDLLEKMGSIRDRQNRYVLQSIEEAAVLWRENFADDEPSVSKIEAASKADQFVSFEVIKRLGGMNAFKQTLGFEARIGAQTLEEAAALWRENFGDEEPSSAKVNAASKAGQFISTGTVNKLGGMNALRKLLGYESRVTAQSIEDAAEIWRANFGDEEPSSKKISVASKEGLFMSGPTLLKLGGMNELRRALNFKVEDKREVPTIQSLEEAAQLWRERFGDEEPTVAKINAASKAGQYVSFSFIQKRLGGMDALKTALGVKQEGYSHPTSLEEAATLWRENFGDEEPGQHKINAASKAGKFISAHALSKLGSMDDFKQTLGFGARASAKSIEEAAQLWRANFGDEEPSQAKIKAASKLGKYVSTQTVSRLGGMDALKTALRDI